MSDEQWTLIEPLLPPVKPGGRPEKHPRRDVVDAILYVVRAGCAWRALPADFPPWQTVYWYFIRWEQAKVTEKILPVVRQQVRAQEGRDHEPTAGLIDSQSVKGADTVGRDSRGYDAGKKINGRKRFIVTDTLGLLLTVMVPARTATVRSQPFSPPTSPPRSGSCSLTPGSPDAWWTGPRTSWRPDCTSCVSPPGSAVSR
jgi:transposase